MIGQTESTRLRDRVLARVAGLLALLAVLGCFPPAAPALTPTPFGQFVSDTGSGEEAAQRSRFNDGQRGLQLRSEEHTSELQSHSDLVCRLLLEKKKESCQLSSTNA